MEGTRRFKIIDTGPAFTWHREFISNASSRAEAQEQYIDACEAAGITHGTLSVFRIRDLAVAA